jgi:hypothetical protein
MAAFGLTTGGETRRRRGRPPESSSDDMAACVSRSSAKPSSIHPATPPPSPAVSPLENTREVCVATMQRVAAAVRELQREVRRAEALRATARSLLHAARQPRSWGPGAVSA